VEGLRPHTRDERRRLVDELVELHRRELGDDLLGLATQGSYARESDGRYSDVELVAFVRTRAQTASWADCVQIHDGILVDVIWTTKDDYIARVKEVTPQWYLSGSDHLGALINKPLIDEVNAYEPRDLRAKCLAEALRHWPVTQEATGKVLNALQRGNTENMGRLFFAMLNDVLVELAFVNAQPYVSTSTAITEALALAKQPRGFGDLTAIALDGGYSDAARTKLAVETVFEGLEELLGKQGLTLYEPELVLRPTVSP